MTFRAPELFDVKTGVTLDEKVDIWVSGYRKHWLRRLTHCSLWAAHSMRLRTTALRSKRRNKQAAQLQWPP